MHRIAVLALPGVLPLDFGIPVQAFGGHARRWYAVTVCAPARTVTAAGGFTLSAAGRLADLAAADTVIVPGYRAHSEPLSPPVLRALRDAHAGGARLVSICTGAFALAQAGVLDGRRAATHWRDAAELARRFPRIEVDDEVLYVDEGDVLTSAGVSAGIDLCLHMIRSDVGAEAAAEVARGLVAAPHRAGDQAQFVATAIADTDEQSLAPTREWALQRLDVPLTLEDLARHACVSRRTLHRRFRAETGVSPLQWLLRARVDHARRLLEATDLGVEQIAGRCGLGTATSLRAHFRRQLRTTPTAYRQAFASTR